MSHHYIELLAVIFLVELAAISVIVWLSQKPKSEFFLKPLQVLIKGRIKIPFFTWPYLEGIWGERKVRVTYLPFNNPAVFNTAESLKERLIIRMSCDFPIKAKITTRGIMTLGGGKKIQLGIADFDNLYNIKTHEEKEVKKFMDPIRRDMIQKLFNLTDVGYEPRQRTRPFSDKWDKLSPMNGAILEFHKNYIILKDLRYWTDIVPYYAEPAKFEKILIELKRLTFPCPR